MDSVDYYKIEELLIDEERTARDRARQVVQKEVLSEVVPCHRAAKISGPSDSAHGRAAFLRAISARAVAKLG
jgi:hypothetical protein